MILQSPNTTTDLIRKVLKFMKSFQYFFFLGRRPEWLFIQLGICHIYKEEVGYSGEQGQVQGPR